MKTAQQIANLEDATITVQFINPLKEGKKNHTVKDTNDGIWLLDPKKRDLLREGETYKIEYDEWSHNGMRFRRIENAYPMSPPRHPVPEGATAASPQPSKKMDQYYRPTSPKDGERMFVCKILGDFIATGRINDDVDTLTRAVNDLRTVWRATFGQDEISGD
jgi:hypothetical protein